MKNENGNMMALPHTLAEHEKDLQGHLLFIPYRD